MVDLGHEDVSFLWGLWVLVEGQVVVMEVVCYSQ